MVQIVDNNTFSDHLAEPSSISYILDSSTLTTPDFPEPNATSFTPRSSPPHFPLLCTPSPAETTAALRWKLLELEISLMGPDSDFCKTHPFESLSDVPTLTLRHVLLTCAQAVANHDLERVAELLHLLEQKVCISGNPLERLGAYMVEGLRARLEFSGSKIYRSLNCDTPISSDMMTYMGFLAEVCPYWKFAYASANAAILDAVQNQPALHIIDFQIAQGNQWIALMKSLAARPGGPPAIRVTGVDDSDSAHARGGGLDIVGRKLTEVSLNYGVPFVFHEAATSWKEIEKERLSLRGGEAVVVNLPYVMHHVPDESVSTWNHRDRILRLVKSLSPNVVTLMEQESNTNTAPFYPRFVETVDYYSAMFESIDVARPRNDGERINAEQHCVARDVVNMISCEDAERVERHELLEKWRSRLRMAGFVQQPMGASAGYAVLELLKKYDRNFRVAEAGGVLYLMWKNRAMVTSSAWL